jgi:hypothetical protein
VRYIIGLGSGRCGTMSLAQLLSRQQGVSIAHERTPALSWDNDADPLRHLKRPKPGTVVCGDVGFYYLPYVETIWKAYPECRFICLKRDRQETVDSFIRYLPSTFDHWNKTGKKSGWDRSFPTIHAETREEAIGLYWDAYYARAEILAIDSRFRIIPMDALNTQEGVMDILSFAQVPLPVPRIGMHLNASRKRKACEV